MKLFTTIPGETDYCLWALHVVQPRNYELGLDREPLIRVELQSRKKKQKKPIYQE
jgi:hypothetical protein